MSDLEKLLAHVAQVVAEDRAAMGDRPVVPSATLDEFRASISMPLPQSPTADDTVVADLVAAALRASSQRGPALLRLRHRRQYARGARRGLADERVGQQRRPLRGRAGRGSDGRNGGTVGGGAPRAPRGDVGRVRQPVE